MGIEQRKSAYEELLKLANKQGYVTFDDIMDAADRFSLPIQDFDWLSSSITTYGIIVYSEKPTSTKQAFNYGDDAHVWRAVLSFVGQPWHQAQKGGGFSSHRAPRQ